jgi:hypothetical protein
MAGATIAKYALTPGRANNAPVSYNSTRVFKNWPGQPINKLTDTLKEGNPQNLKIFLERLTTSSSMAGLKCITKVKNDLRTQYN